MCFWVGGGSVPEIPFINLEPKRRRALNVSGDGTRLRLNCGNFIGAAVRGVDWREPMIDCERVPFLHNPPVHFDFLRTLDELEASRPPQRAEALARERALPSDEERRAWHRLDLPGGGSRKPQVSSST